MGFIFLSSSSRLEPSLSGLCSGQFVKNDLGNKCLVGEWVAGWIQGDWRCALPIRLQIVHVTIVTENGRLVKLSLMAAKVMI